MFLLLIREREKVTGEHKQALREIWEEFKPVYEKVVEEQKKTINTDINELKNYIFSEEASERKEWESLILHFEDEAKLEEHIKDNWESKAFMEELFSFFNEGVSADCSEKLRKRFQLICNIVAKLYLKGEGKSWFWKIRHILYMFEEHFVQKNS